MLSQLIEDPEALPRVARTALSLMHFNMVDEAIASGDPALLTHQPDACVRGCYRCLLSYYNQPDHQKIDRTSDEAKQLLIDIARGKRHLSSPRPAADESTGWLATFKKLGLPTPDSENITLAGQSCPYVWRINRVAATTGPLTEAALAYGDEMGWTLFELPSTVTPSLPEELIAALKS